MCVSCVGFTCGAYVCLCVMYLCVCASICVCHVCVHVGVRVCVFPPVVPPSRRSFRVINSGSLKAADAGAEILADSSAALPAWLSMAANCSPCTAHRENNPTTLGQTNQSRPQSPDLHETHTQNQRLLNRYCFTRQAQVTFKATPVWLQLC